MGGSSSSTGERDNVKITDARATSRGSRGSGAGVRIGQGIDVHRVSDDPARPLVLGLRRACPGAPGLVGHSDADVATHALCDALLGAAGPRRPRPPLPRRRPGDRRGRVASSCSRARCALVERRGPTVVSADVTIVAERPAPRRRYMAQMSERSRRGRGRAVSVKATTAEGLGALGRVEGIAATAVVLLDEAAVSPPARAGRTRRGTRRRADGAGARAPATTAREREGLGGEQVEGRRAVLELLRARRRRVQRVLRRRGARTRPSILDADRARGAAPARRRCTSCSMARLDREARTEGHQGVMARRRARADRDPVRARRRRRPVPAGLRRRDRPAQPRGDAAQRRGRRRHRRRAAAAPLGAPHPGGDQDRGRRDRAPVRSATSAGVPTRAGRSRARRRR